ncbi:MAG TPA: ATP-binding protein [Thermoanaerobaculia bacterium]|nr:ATP-binding protein [Thermoanaerobaculia bacterium]
MSRLRHRLIRHRKDGRLIVAALVLLLALFTAGFVFLLRGRDLPASLVTNRVLLLVLWYIDAVLILTILFVLLRNVLKLLIERRNRILGSKLKTKLILTYVGLALVPGLLLFVYASGALERSIDRWFAAPVRQVLEQGHAVAEAMDRRIEEAGLRGAARVAREMAARDLADLGARPRLQRRLAELREELGADLVAVYSGGELVHAVVDPQAGLSNLPEAGRGFLRDVTQRGQGVRRPQEWQGRLILAAAAAGTGENPPVAVVGTLVDPELAAQSAQLLQAYQTFRQFEVQKGQLKLGHLLTFLMVTLLILLAASWTGLYLARRVTVPIQALADGTRRISEGDLAHRVDVAADDELGVLVGSFNRMTAELERGRALRERSNSELREANQRLAEERALIAAVLENVAAGVISLDSEGRIFTCNGAALAMLRQREEEVLGRLAAEAWGDPERARLLALLAEPPAAGRSRRELRLVLGGSWKTFEVKITGMRDAAGAEAGRVVVLEDLTELIQAQQLAAWSEAARRVAHEIKNPLTPIRLAAERLLRKHAEGDPQLGAALEEGVEIIVREVETMKRMVDEFSRFARMPRPQPGEVDMERLLDETLHLYRDLKPGVEVAGEVAPAARQARLDGEQIKSALINLLDNAVEATGAPGRVEVRVAARDGHLEIQIADTGPGIPPEAKSKLFLPYFSTKGRGTGLGLAIVHRIVTDHHGTIRVDDNRPRGTVFTIALPQG